MTGPSLLAAGLNTQPASQQLAGAVLALLIVVCTLLGLLAVCLIYSVLAPRRVELGSRLQRQDPRQSFSVGALVFVIYLLFAIISRELQPPKSLAVLVWLPLLCVFLYLLLTGLAMTAHSIGERIQSNLNSRSLGSTFLAVFYGGSVLLCLNFLPLLGQALIFVAGLISLGTAVRVLSVERSERRKPAPAATPPSPPAESGK